MPEITLSDAAVSDNTAAAVNDVDLTSVTTPPPENYIKQYLQQMLAEPLDFPTSAEEAIWQPDHSTQGHTHDEVRCHDLAPVVDTNALYWWSYQGLLPSAELRHLLYRQFLQLLLLSYRLGSRRVRQIAVAECRHIWAALEDNCTATTRDQDY